MNIDWPKVSEIAFDASLQAVISAAVIYFTFRLGQWQADRNRKKDIEQREKERDENEKYENNKRKIQAISDLIDLYHLMWLRFVDGKGLEIEEKTKARSIIMKVYPLFEESEDIETVKILDRLEKATFWPDLYGPMFDEQGPVREERRKELGEFSQVLRERLAELEKSLGK
jgi:hypothetical protein